MKLVHQIKNFEGGGGGGTAAWRNNPQTPTLQKNLVFALLVLCQALIFGSGQTRRLGNNVTRRMTRSKTSLLTVLSLSLLLLGKADIASANPSIQIIAQLNQSDVTGTNVGDIVAPIVLDEDTIEGLDPATLQTAQQLSQDLEEAYAACQASRATAANTPRRFARGSAATEVCTSPDCDRLNSLMQQARTFLNSLNDEDAAQIRSTGFQLW